jgi:hypothetical protein
MVIQKSHSPVTLQMRNDEKHFGQEPEPRRELNNGNGLHCLERNATSPWNSTLHGPQKVRLSKSAHPGFQSLESKQSSGKVGDDLTLQQNGDAQAWTTEIWMFNRVHYTIFCRHSHALKGEINTSKETLSECGMTLLFS